MTTDTLQPLRHLAGHAEGTIAAAESALENLADQRERKRLRRAIDEAREALRAVYRILAEV